MGNIVVRQDFGLEFLAKAKPLRPRTNITGNFETSAYTAPAFIHWFHLCGWSSSLI